MNFDQPKKEIIKTPEAKIKEGVDFVFEQNPELVNTAYEALRYVDFSVSENSGYVTLYRAEGETVDRDKLLPFQKGNAGTWFSPDQKELLRYVAMAQDRKAYKIDIPKSLYDSLNNIAKSNVEMSKGEVQLPIELADKKEILTSENESVVNKNNFKSWIISNRIKSGEITESQKQEAEKVYSRYLETIFPDSKVKDIVYHSTNDKFDNFDKSKIGSAIDNIVKTKTGNPFDAFYFAPDTNYHKDNPYRISNLISVMVNIERLFQEHQSIVEKQIAYSNNAKLGYANPIKRENDGAIFYADDGKPIQVLVFEPENIHILGSKQDIEKFKEFISESKSEQVTD